MEYLITIIILWSAGFAFDQDQSKNPRQVALNHFYNGEYDEAKQIYKAILDTVEWKAYDSYMLGECYRASNQLDTAEIVFLRILKFEKPKLGYVQVNRMTCHSLADLYLEQNNYRSALNYLELAEKKYPHFKVCSAGEFERETTLNYKFAQCYGSLYQLDKAIKCLTPYVFHQNDNYLLDSLKFQEISEYYLNLLLQKYQNSYLKSHLNSTVNYMFYEEGWENPDKKQRRRLTYNLKHIDFYRVYCSINFLEEEIILIDNAYRDIHSKEAHSKNDSLRNSIPVMGKFYSEEYFKNYLMEVPIIKLINALPNDSVKPETKY